MATRRSSTTLTKGWAFKKGGKDTEAEWLSANDLPTEVHLDLLKNDKISDPFIDLNELSVRWIADETWTYRTNFPTPADYGTTGVTTVLRFGGLDTFACIYLNGVLLLETDNMFLEHVVDVSGKLKADNGAEQVLEIVFESARSKGLELVEKYKGEHWFIVHQTEISRGPVRKAQYHWGWDWGPILMTVGPWKPVTVETYTSKIVDVWVEYNIDADLKQVEGKVFVEIEGSAELKADITKDGQSLQKLGGFKPTEKRTVLTADFELADVSLWWPRGYGSQPLYTVAVSLHSSSESSRVIDEASKTIGFRKVELVQEDDNHGTSFYFRINDIDIFCGGSCWIPADSFLTRPTTATYRAWIKQAAEGNQIMVRVWGGGIYEDDAFFEAADECGVLIWQDFAFACANYPANRPYLDSVELEARQNVRRLRNHPSLVIWAGNNEDYQVVERYNLEYDFANKDPESWLRTNFPARYIYEYVLPKVVSEEMKNVPYHPSSPFGNGTSTVLKVDPTVGDIHQWNVWHGTMEPYQRLPQMGGRFVSEFGMEAYPHLSTLYKSITNPDDRYPGSMTIDFRNKAIGHERRIISYVTENFRVRYDIEAFTHLTQVMQSDALTAAYRSWRRDWKQPGNRKCGGILVWQLNDCWPTTSWALVDYYGVPKPSYHSIRRTLNPVVVGVQRKLIDWTVRPADKLWQRDTSHIDMRKLLQDVQYDVWVSSNKRESITGNVTVKFISVKTGKEVLEPLEKTVRIEPNATTEVVEKGIAKIPNSQNPDKPLDISKVDPFIIYTALAVDGKQVATDVSWPEPIKYLSFPDRGVQVECSDDKKTVYVSATKPVKGFVFHEKEGVKLSDNGFDVVPGEKKEIHVEGSSADAMKWRYVEMP